MKASAELKTPLIPATVRPRAKGEGDAMTLDSNIRAALERHWAASDANDFNAEHHTDKTRCLSTRNRASGFAAATEFRRLEWRSRTTSDFQCGELLVLPISG